MFFKSLANIFFEESQPKNWVGWNLVPESMAYPKESDLHSEIYENKSIEE